MKIVLLLIIDGNSNNPCFLLWGKWGRKKRKEKGGTHGGHDFKFRTCLICTNAINNSKAAHVLSGVFVTISM